MRELFSEIIEFCTAKKLRLKMYIIALIVVLLIIFLSLLIFHFAFMKVGITTPDPIQKTRIKIAEKDLYQLLLK